MHLALLALLPHAPRAACQGALLHALWCVVPLQVKCTQQSFYEKGAEALSSKAQREIEMDTVTPALKLAPQAALAAIKPAEGRTSRVLELDVVLYAPGDKMGSPSQKQWLAVEVGPYGSEAKFEAIVTRGYIPTTQHEGSFFGKIYCDAMALDVAHPAWQRAFCAMIAGQLERDFGTRPAVESVTKLHPFGPSERRQGTNALLAAVFCPPGMGLPKSFTRLLHLPNGIFAHDSWREEGATGKVLLTFPVLVRWYLPGASEKGVFYPEEKGMPPREHNAANHWRRDFRRLKLQALQRNARMQGIKPRSSPRLSESAKRRRTEAVRGGAAQGPGAVAMQALGLGDDPDEAAAKAAAAAQVEAEMQVDGEGGLGGAGGSEVDIENL